MNQTWARFLPGILRRKIEGRHSLQKALGNTGWMMGDQVLRKVIGLVIGVLIARHFGPDLYGEFSFAIAVAVIVAPVVRLGLDEIVIRDLAKDPSGRDQVLGTTFLLMLGGGTIAFLAAMISSFLARPESDLVHWLVGILTAGCIVQAFWAIELWFESQMQWKYTVYAKTSAFLLVSICKLALLLMQAPLIAFAWAGLAETVLGSVGLVLVYRHRGYGASAWRFSRALAKNMLGDSWPLLLSALLTMVYLRIDQVMIASMLGSSELGKYSVAVQLSEVWIFIPMVVVSAVFPAFVEVERDNEELFYAHLQRLYRMMALYGYLVAVPITIFAEEIVHFLFSAAYGEAATLAAVLVWAMVFSSLGAARNILVVAKNWTRVNLMSVGLGGAANILLNLILIPRHGAMGAVIATLISYWFAVHGTCFFFQSLRPTGWMITRAILYPKAW